MVSPNPARVRGRHGLARFAAESFLKLRHVAHYAVYAPFAGRMRVHTDQHARQFWGCVLAPDAAKAEEKALIGRIAVNLFVGILMCLGHHVMQRHEGNPRAAIVRGIFTQSEAAI
jgi:hypothetical protein